MALGPRSHGNLPPGTCDSLALPCPVDTRPQRRGQCPAGASPSVGECRRARSDPRVLPAACEEAGEPTLIAGPLPRRPQRGAGHSGVGAGLHVLGCVGRFWNPDLGAVPFLHACLINPGDEDWSTSTLGCVQTPACPWTSSAMRRVPGVGPRARELPKAWRQLWCGGTVLCPELSAGPNPLSRAGVGRVLSAYDLG